MSYWRTIVKFVREDISVEPVILLYMTAIFMEISITQDLIFTKLCLRSANVSDVSNCRNQSNIELENSVKNETSRWISYYSVCMCICTLVAASYIGSWSDRFSRKYTMLIPPIGSILATIVAIANGQNMEWGVGLLLISAFLSGISGGIVAINASAFGYIADITTQEKRTKRIVVLEAMIFLGATIGMSGGGALNKRVKANKALISSFAVVFILELIILLLVTLYIIFCINDVPTCGTQTLPEMESIPERKPSIFYRLFNVNHVIESVKTIFKYRDNNSRLHIILLLTTSFLVFFALSVQQTLLYLFVTSGPLYWSQEMYSYYSATTFGMSGLALIVGLPLAFHFYNVRDTTFGMLGILSKMAGLILLGFSKSTPLAYMCTVLFIFSEYPVPAIRSILSKIVQPDEKGKIFAFMQVLQNLCLILGSQIFNPLYVATPFFPGLTFEIVAGFQAVALGILFYIHNKLPNLNVPYQTMEDNEVTVEAD